MSFSRYSKDSEKANEKSQNPETFPTNPVAHPTFHSSNEIIFDKFALPGLGLAWHRLEATLPLLERSMGTFPSLKLAVGGLVALLDLGEVTENDAEEYTRLATEFTITAEILAQYGPALAASNIKGSIARIMELINMELTYIKQLQDRNKIRKTIIANQNQGSVIQCYRRIESLFHQLQSEITLRTWNDDRKLIEVGLLEDMSPVYEALYNSDYSTTIFHRRGCSPGTREKVLEDLKAWVGNPRGSKIYWMNGIAGSGKTTISYTLCEWLKKNNQLGANFFCAHASVRCNNVNWIIPTLAYQLAEYSLSFRSMLCHILDEELGSCGSDVQLQFQKLLQRPFQAMKAAMPDNVVVVIDALDQCDESSIFHLFLDTLLELAVNLPIRFFITSRPKLASRCKTLAPNVLYLRDIEESTASADIREHLTKALASTYPTPSFDQVEQLVKSAGGRLIYATTAIRYICSDDSAEGPWDRLEMILGTAPGSTELYDDLDKLYTTILHGALYPTNKPRVEGERTNILLVLKAVVCAKEPMTIKTLASLLSLTEEQVRFSLQPLQSVLNMQENVEEPIVPFHTSFPDFLFDERRSKEFHCERTVHNEILATSGHTSDVIRSSDAAGAPHPPQIALLKVKDVDGKYIDIPLYEPLHWQKLCNFLVEKQAIAKQHLSSGNCVVYTREGLVLVGQEWDDWIALAIVLDADNPPPVQVELRVVRKSCCDKLSDRDRDVCNNCRTPLFDIDIPPPPSPATDTIDPNVRDNHSTPLLDMDMPLPTSPTNAIELVPIPGPVINTPHIEIQRPPANDILDGSRGITTSIDITYTSENSVVRRRKWQSSEESGEGQRSQEDMGGKAITGNEDQKVDSQGNNLHKVVHVLLTLYLYLINPPVIALPFGFWELIYVFLGEFIDTLSGEEQ